MEEKGKLSMKQRNDNMVHRKGSIQSMKVTEWVEGPETWNEAQDRGSSR